MFNEIKRKIEQKRWQDGIIWRFLVAIKDVFWIVFEFLKNKNNKKTIFDFIRKNYLPKNKENMSKIFENVYKKNGWQKGSGPGSFPNNTVEYREFLKKFFKENKIKTVLDAGCGDWQFSKLINWDRINYTGIDVVPFIIKYNIKNYSKKNIKFFKKDFLNDRLPPAELIIIKDVFQHLTTENIINFLPKLKNFKFALLINDFAEENTDCENGHFRPLNLKKTPFNLKAEEIFFFNKKQALLVKN